MLEAGTVIVFCAALFASVIVGWSIIPALGAGLVLFLGYGLVRHRSAKRMVVRALRSVKDAGVILVTFALIGIMTSLWRAGGTIAFIVVHAVPWIHGAAVVPLSFLLCAGMSVLVGSSFASAATMGTVCMALGRTMGADAALLGGAILAGVYVGDRCSPVSTSALLVKQLTRTNLFDNLGRMLRTGLIPFVLTCLAYAVAGLPGLGVGAGTGTEADAATAATAAPQGTSPGTDVVTAFGGAFDLHWATVLPAVLVIVLAALRVDVRITMSASIIASAAICACLQHVGWQDLLSVMVFGYASSDPTVGALLDGGGILTMVTVGAIVCISSAYAGIFAETGMLAGLQQGIEAIGARAGAYAATLVTSIAAAMVACNQTLTIMLTRQLCAGAYREEIEDDATAGNATGESGDGKAGTDGDKTGRGRTDRDKTEGDGPANRRMPSANARQAIDLEDSAVIVPALIPWSIACAVPLSTIGAPASSIAFACFLYLLPVCRLVEAAIPRHAGRRHIARGGNGRRCDTSHSAAPRGGRVAVRTLGM
ncbi:sodium:proton antiporter [Bifidobacterium sp. DSM 109958]|uniref:Sodium:proton antiporter n=1 Tax=Bifidobacterium moraviense TaxID=2675323 RepID=A0A7Y0F100_9BIFI|nr:Na+/H+ antiporter NhaC family protein [Bifidobacterium sp. DSM 109958]NMN00031.1 sodium:proton antiporter [Bifidobacterium sp. DSM 109958]